VKYNFADQIGWAKGILMDKKASWKSQIPTLLGAMYGVYFGFSGGVYKGSPGAMETAHTWLSVGFGAVNLALVGACILLMRAMRAYEKQRQANIRYQQRINGHRITGV
jgi:hypothetical protein